MASAAEILPYTGPASTSSYTLPGSWWKELRELNEKCLQFHRVSIKRDVF